MSLVSKKVLVITEGPRDELHLIKSICRDLGIADVDFYSYKTDFHNFARIMLPDGALKPDDTIDLLLELKSHEPDEKEREILSGIYTDVYIVFDFDPHVSKPEFEKILILAKYFTSSSDMDRLFVNYPMLQSYRHLKTLPDMGYAERTVSMAEILGYKELVFREGATELQSVHDYNHIQLMEIAAHNYIKREKMLGRTGEIRADSKYNGLDDIKILEIELSELRENGRCYVLNTSSLMYLDYNPKNFFTEISRHRNRFRI